MSLDLDKLEKPRVRNGYMIARCPVCARHGKDTACDNLRCWSPDGDGPYHCIVKCDDKEIFAIAGRQKEKPSRFAIPPVTRPPTRQKPAPRVHALRKPTLAEELAIAELRHWPVPDGLGWLSARGLLHTGEVWDDGAVWPAWIIADSSRRNLQARKFDGSSWRPLNGAPCKAKSLQGCQGWETSWPIGAADIGNRPVVLLTEGGPDFCATLSVACFEGVWPDAIAPVCMTGAANPIHPDALPYFAGKHVRIAVHNDAKGQGQAAGDRWSQQLYLAGATLVDRIDFASSDLSVADGKPIKDLADFATLLYADDPPDVQTLVDLGPLTIAYSDNPVPHAVHVE